MANEAFALSPISASAALPSADDYQAISDAFMETSRGRWFLTEYARRNRNADTAMVLEAVARIETTIATQKQVAASTTLAEAAATMRGFVGQATSAATDALDHFTTTQDFMPTRRGVRIIREVAWRLREVGYDSRICDILEAQANAIDTNHDPSVAQGLRDAVLQAFETLDRRIADLAGDDGEATEAPPTASAPEAARETAMPASATEAQVSESLAPEALTPEALTPEGLVPEAVAPELQVPESPASAQSEAGVAHASAAAAYSAPPGEADDMAAQAAADLSHATAPLDLHPAAAPLPEPVEMAEGPVAELPPAEALYAPELAIAPEPGEVDDVRDALAPAPQVVGELAPELDIDTDIADTDIEAAVELDLAAAAGAVAPPVQPEASRPASLIPPNTLSLGESLLARGMVATPAAKTDPLAPIRRMSQAEKIAFFS